MKVDLVIESSFWVFLEASLFFIEDYQSLSCVCKEMRCFLMGVVSMSSSIIVQSVGIYHLMGNTPHEWGGMGWKN